SMPRRPRPPTSTLFPYTTLFRSALAMFAATFGVEPDQARRHLEPTPREAFDEGAAWARANAATVRMLRTSPQAIEEGAYRLKPADRKSTRLNSSHSQISYAVFCL